MPFIDDEYIIFCEIDTAMLKAAIWCRTEQ